MILEEGLLGYYSVVIAEKHHINMSINLLTKSICKPTINKFVPIRNKLAYLCQWADKEQHNLKPIEEPTMKNEQTMIFLNKHNILEKKSECDDHRSTRMEQMKVHILVHNTHIS